MSELGMDMATVAGSLAPRRRPFGVSVVAVLSGVQAVLYLAAGALALATFFAVGFNIVGAAFGTVSVISLALGFGYVALTRSLWRLSHWAYYATIIIAALADLNQIGYMVFASTPNYASAIASMVIPTVVGLYFLFSRRVRDAFDIL